MQRFRGWLAIIGITLYLGLTTSVVRAGFVAGANPFDNFAGTGISTSNEQGSVGGWHDSTTGSAPWRTNDAVLYYEERWATPQYLAAVMLATSRQADGEVLVTFTPGGPLTVLAAAFSVGGNSEALLDVGFAGIYGVRIEVNGSTDPTYFQMGDVALLGASPGVNLALGNTTIMSPSSQWTGSVTDGNYGTAWRAGTTVTENWVGFEFAGSQTVQAIHITGSLVHGAVWGWHDFDVQLKQSGVWGAAVGRAAMPAGDNLYWIDLETPVSVEGIRLYGSDAGGNNPGAGGGKIIDELLVFGASNQSPVAVCNNLSIDAGVVIDAAAVGAGSSDPENQTLTYTVTPPGPFYFAGDYAVTLTVTDSEGGQDTCVATITVAGGCVVADLVPGQNPFTNIAGTGVFTANAAPAAWHDGSVGSSAYILKTSGVLYYEERWTTPQDLATVLIEPTDRQAGGTILVTSTPGGPLTEVVGTFSVNPRAGALITIGSSAIYGVRVEVNSTTDASYYQIGEIELLASSPGANLALGHATVSSGGSTYGDGSLTDQDYFTEWRADPIAGENWVGVEFPVGQAQTIQALRVVSTGRHANTWDWRDYDVQLKQAGSWSAASGRATVPAGVEVYWLDFETPVTVEGVRVYGSDAGGNNPTANDGKIVDDIYIFAAAEPPVCTTCDDMFDALCAGLIAAAPTSLVNIQATIAAIIQGETLCPDDVFWGCNEACTAYLLGQLGL